MINQLNVSSQTFKGGLLSVSPAKATKVTSRQIEQMGAYPISFNAMQIMTHSKGSSPQVARQLKALDGTLACRLGEAQQHTE